MYTAIYATAVFLLISILRTRKLRAVGNRVCPLPGQDELLDEVRRLDIGWPRGFARICLLGLVIIACGFRFYDYYTTGRAVRWNDGMTGALIDGFFIGSILSVLPILGWTPWQWGAVTVNPRELRVPRIFKVLVFERSDKTRILAQSGVGDEYMLCLIEDDSKSAQFYISRRSLKYIRIWAAHPVSSDPIQG